MSDSINENWQRLYEYAEKACERDETLIKEITNPTLINNFKNRINYLHKYKEFLSEVKGNGFFVSGSSVLWGLEFSPNYIPHDIDIYRTSSDNKSIINLDKVIHKIYKNYTIVIFKTNYIINWYVLNHKGKDNDFVYDNSSVNTIDFLRFFNKNFIFNKNLLKTNKSLLEIYGDIDSVDEHKLSESEFDILFRTKNIDKYVPVKDRKYFNKPVYHDNSSPYPSFLPVIISFQLMLPPCEKVSDIWAGYHSDIVCCGYDIDSEKLLYANGRFDYFYNTNQASFFPQLVHPKFREKVKNAFYKYTERNHNCIYIENITDIDDSEEIYYRKISSLVTPSFELNNICVKEFFNSYCRNNYRKNITSILDSLNYSNKITRVSTRLIDVFDGQMFKPIITSLNPMDECPRCTKINLFKSYCISCKNLEKAECITVKNNLSLHTGSVLITGGRCGLGMHLVRIFEECGWDVNYTSRYPKLTEKALKLDLSNIAKDNIILNNLNNRIYDLVILNASETLHFTEKPTSDMETDWTGDKTRNNSGVWYKTIDEHSIEEITSPINANIIGNTILIKHFISGIKKVGPANMIYISSFESSFDEKSPFHPVTNCTKSAMEQVIHTIQRQLEILESNIIIADPKWMYTEGSSSKIKGPVPINFGVKNILKKLYL